MVDENAPAPAPRYAPSNSTMLGTVGGAGLSPVLVWALSLADVTMPPEVAASLGAIIGNVIGYFFEGGRKT